VADVEPIAPYLGPLRKTCVVPIPRPQAFDLFTARLQTWWPLATHSVHQANAKTCGFDPHVGGDLYEKSITGERCVWGTVLVWDPPRRFVVTWHPGRGADTAQELEVRFVPDRSGTRVELEHRGWQALGPEAEAMRERYTGGWEGVLARYVTAAEARNP